MSDNPSTEGWEEGVRSAMGAPPLSRSDTRQRPWDDPKFLTGDALMAIPAEHRDEVARAVGLDIGTARRYVETAEAWPPHTRTHKASWTVYRDLRHIPERFQIIRDGMTLRDVCRLLNKEIDRPALGKMSDDQVIGEFANIFMGPRGKGVVTRLVKVLNSTKEGRKIARARRASAALKRLEKEARALQDQIGKVDPNSPKKIYMKARQGLVNTQVNVEQMHNVFITGRELAEDEEWLESAEKLAQLSFEASKVARFIEATVKALEAEDLGDEPYWLPPELMAGDDDVDHGDIEDADVVDED